MCGIAGIASRRLIENRHWLSSAMEVLRHRGPDASGQWWAPDGRLGFVHRRLAIVDLSPAGLQPMHDASGALSIVFNGEIYNFQELRTELLAKGHGFRSHSDTEVILTAYREWGADCLTHLNGMFAFALHDARAEHLLLGRDRAGEKPLFYAESEGQIRFASELKGLMADPALARQVDPASLDCYLAMGFVPGGRSMLRGVNKLQPAHALLFDLKTGTSRTWRYWNLPDLVAASSASDEVPLLDELERLMEDAVRRQLVADVPVGVLLSGGVDSSLVTAMAARARTQVKTFTVRFPGAGKLDETEHARLIAQHFATEHIELEAEASTVDLLPLMARQFDDPVNDSSMIPTFLVSRLVRRHCTVALGGDGGDELFGGYSHYDRLLWLERRFGRVPRCLRAAAARFATAALPLGYKGRNWLQALDTDFENDVPLIATYFDHYSRRQLLGSPSATFGTAEQVLRQVVLRGSDLLQRATRLDFENYLAEDILVKVDRASMLSSLEVRAPMLDHRLIEFAFGRVPSHLKTTPSGRKILLKKLAERVLPPSFDKQRKQGFSIPMAAWLDSGPWLDFFREVLLDPGQQHLSRRSIEKLFQGQKKGHSNGERLFGLLMFELWRREYHIQL